MNYYFNRITMEDSEYFGKAKTGVVRSKPPLKELILFTILLTPFLLVFSSPFWLFLVEDISFQETACCGIPGFFLTWIVGYQFFLLWSKSEVSIDVDRDEVAFKQSLIVTPGLYWRTIKKPLSELTNIEYGKRIYQSRGISSNTDMGYLPDDPRHHSNWDNEESTRTSVAYFVKLHGYSILQGKPWDLEISDVICRGWSKTPDLGLVRDLAKLLGLPSPRKEEVFPDGEPKKQVIWTGLIIPGLMIVFAIFFELFFVRSLV